MWNTQCPSTREWIQKMWYIHTPEYCYPQQHAWIAQNVHCVCVEIPQKYEVFKSWNQALFIPISQHPIQNRCLSNDFLINKCMCVYTYIQSCPIIKQDDCQLPPQPRSWEKATAGYTSSKPTWVCNQLTPFQPAFGSWRTLINSTHCTSWRAPGVHFIRVAVRRLPCSFTSPLGSQLSKL